MLVLREILLIRIFGLLALEDCSLRRGRCFVINPPYLVSPRLHMPQESRLFFLFNSFPKCTLTASYSPLSQAMVAMQDRLSYPVARACRESQISSSAEYPPLKCFLKGCLLQAPRRLPLRSLWPELCQRLITSLPIVKWDMAACVCLRPIRSISKLEMGAVPEDCDC